MATPHKHAALIKAWADGAEIQVRGSGEGDWRNSPHPYWDRDFYRIKPERKYPKSTLTSLELTQIWSCTEHSGNPYRDIADAAVKRYIQDTEK